MMAAYSRGSASAAIFSQLLYARGLVDPVSKAQILAPGSIGVNGAVMLDPVVTGVAGNLSFAPGTENVLIVQSLDEFRQLFPAADFGNPDIQTVKMFGNHGDVGGIYRGGIGAAVLQGTTRYFENLGLPIDAPPEGRRFDPTAPIEYHTESVDAFGNQLWDEHGTRGNRLVSVVGQPATAIDDSGAMVRRFLLHDGLLLTERVSADGTVAISVSHTGAATMQNTVAQYGSTLIDALSMMRAIQSGEPLPIATSGLRLANDLATLNGNANIHLGAAANVTSGLLSLLSLDAALKRGDHFAALTAGAHAVNFGATAYANLAGFTDTSAGSAVSKAFGQDSPFTSLNESLPYLNLVNAIAHGDETGIAVAAISMVPGMQWVGVAYAVFDIIGSLFGDGEDIPDPWGNGRYTWNGDGISYEAAGETGGQEAVSAVLDSVLATMNSLIERERQQNPGSALGVIPDRMPDLGYDMSGYRYININPLTAEQRHPELRFDTTGRPYNAAPGSPESFQSLVEGMVRSALMRGAIAPLWEVQTARLQNLAGDPKAGLTEEERAARDGFLAAPGSGSTQIFRPVVLDLDGDGIETTDLAGGVAFNVDDSGYLKRTAWVGTDDAFLILDRDYNGSFDSGRELFANATVALARRGLAGMTWVDSNHDGQLTPADPVWEELRLWRDADQDGAQDAAEVVRPDDLGITALNFAMSTYTMAGQVRQMASPDLEADRHGSRVSIIDDGILIESSASGQLSLLVTRIDDKTAVEPNRDGISGLEDIEIIVNGADLTANDLLGGFPKRPLVVTDVTNFRHGSGFVDANGYVHFLPEADYAGEGAGFDYIARAQNGQQANGTVDVTLTAVNDAPVLGAVTIVTRPVYGFTDSSRYQDLPSDNWIDVPGTPLYSPYGFLRGFNEDGGVTWTLVHEPPPALSYIDYHNIPIASEATGQGTLHGHDSDDAPSSLHYALVNQPQYGSVSMDADGSFLYTSWKAPGVPSDRLVIDGQYAAMHEGSAYHPGNLPAPGIYPVTDVFEVRITDPHGASSIASVTVPHYGPWLPPMPPGGTASKKPISVDLTGNGFDFIDIDDSNVFFDVNGDGWRRRTAWVGKDDGLLAYDANGDGKITRAEEISFALHGDTAQTDLQGLAAFDSNRNGVFDPADSKWTRFGVWQDVNQDGITDAGEFSTLAEMGVISVGLRSDGRFQIIDGQTIHGIGSMQLANGTTLAIADVTLATGRQALSPSGGIQLPAGESPFAPRGEQLHGTAGADLIPGSNGDTIISAGDGNDVVFEDHGNDVIDAGAGDDVAYAGRDNDLVLAGDGNDVVFAGWGDDLLFGGHGDDALLGEGGNDVIFGDNGNDFIAGGMGNDVLSGDAGDDAIYGESGNDALFGRHGDDALHGMDGNDLLMGGDGDDVLDGGAGNDRMEGGAGDDLYVVEQAGDHIAENPDEGSDTVRIMLDHYILGPHLENLVLSGSYGLTASGNERDNRLTGNAGDNLLGGGAGNDRLDGGKGRDTLVGGSGDDVYVVDDSGDELVEQADEGIDTVFASASVALAANIEHVTLTGSDAIDALGNALANRMTGNAARNLLDGGAGTDVLEGGGGDDVLRGGAGDDRYLYASGDGVDRIDDVSGIDTVRLGPGSSVATIALRVDTAGAQLMARLRLLDANGNEQDDQGIDFAIRQTANGRYLSPIERFEMADGSIKSFDDLLIRTRVISGSKDAAIITGRDDDIVHAGPKNNLIRTGTGNDVIHGSPRADALFGEGGQDWIDGANGDDTIDGGWGNDILDGGNGRDLLRDQHGNNAIIGGMHDDRIATGAGNDFIAGGKHNDEINAGAGANVIAFNRGDGRDTLLSTGGASNTLSLGGVSALDLWFSRTASDLVLHVSASDVMTLRDWYANADSRNIDRLQLVSNDKARSAAATHGLPAAAVELFDFHSLAQQYEASTAARRNAGTWSLADGLRAAHIDNGAAVLGGELAASYALTGMLPGSTVAIQALLHDPNFGLLAASAGTPASAAAIENSRSA